MWFSSIHISENSLGQLEKSTIYVYLLVFFFFLKKKGRLIEVVALSAFIG